MKFVKNVVSTINYILHRIYAYLLLIVLILIVFNVNKDSATNSECVFQIIVVNL